MNPTPYSIILKQSLTILLGLAVFSALASAKPVKVFILAGDENVLEQALVEPKPKAESDVGTLQQVVRDRPEYRFLRDAKGEWTYRDDVLLYDAHPLHNNTEAPAKPVKVEVIGMGGRDRALAVGVDLMLSHRLGQALDEPVLIIRYGVKHPTWFFRGSRSLAHDFRPPSSGGASDLDGGWDIIHFNFGVWDAFYREKTSRFYDGRHTTSVEDYERNLRTIVAKLKKTGATLIWGTVTPVPDGEPGKPTGDEVAFNRVAAKVMKENGVIINDLYAESKRLGYPKRPDVHSVGDLSPKVTAVVKEAIANLESPTQPLPRVLFIGDSITGSYKKKVFRNLDGIAVPFKNPGNAEGTWTGVKRIDEWIDLDRYLLNGEEYLGLVDGVRKVMGEEAARAYPGNLEDGMELAGLFWVQGDDDASSPAKAAEYEANLANLIRDLRRDFAEPELPVVVAAMSNSKGKMSANRRQVFEAQMAVSDPGKYPEFAGNVRSIDTRPLCRPPSESPGGKDTFNANAASHLELGDAMAEAMLKMTGAQRRP
jgi:hypothetical protein